jgi:cellobiose phosphorylase
MKIEYIDDNNSFEIQDPEVSYLYAPLVNEGGIMSSITPTLHGDSKTSQNSFLLEPVSNEDLHTSLMGRNVWFRMNEHQPWAANGMSPQQLMDRCGEKKESVIIQVGKYWQTMKRSNPTLGIQIEVTSFCPAGKEQAEIMRVVVTNIGEKSLTIQPIIAIPLYGRSADNIRDHRQVTALLNRIYMEEDGIRLVPTMSFDERGHQQNENSYGAYARGQQGELPIGFYPVLEEFIGEGGNLVVPAAVMNNQASMYQAGDEIHGYEAMGGIVFQSVTLQQEETKEYSVVLNYNGEGRQYLDTSRLEQALEEVKQYWNAQEKITISSGEKRFDQWMSWVVLQPVLRRIFGCSFLPHHDYGRGGRGWRDLWQDSLALLLADSSQVRNQLVRYFDGVRIDGSNATIIGVKPGEFIADRNSIVRVWMDHGVWPLITTKLYVDQTGDFDMLLEPATYFKDRISHRGDGVDQEWNGLDHWLQTKDRQAYKGTILEHLLVQQLTSFYDVGEHNHIRLRGADWNDALDMAKDRGESVAFTAAYAGNLKQFASMLLALQQKKGISAISVAEELQILLDGFRSCTIKEKQAVLKQYCDCSNHRVSGKTIEVEINALAKQLEEMGNWISQHIRETELIEDQQGNQWFNGYYDNHGRQLEGNWEEQTNMTLTGQVFTILSNTATDKQVASIIKAADHYLYDASIGGYKLNTNFHEMKMDMGRMFGFAYGHKENGAVFSHMAVMYGYSLYSRGFAEEGYKVLHTLFEQSDHFEVSKIYPGIPEYFNDKGRGMYHYLTGAASWYVYTVLTQMYGVRGQYGDLLLCPQLLAKQFDEKGNASIVFEFAGKHLQLTYVNEGRLDAGEYKIGNISIDGKMISCQEDSLISRESLLQLEDGIEHHIIVTLHK